MNQEIHVGSGKRKWHSPKPKSILLAFIVVVLAGGVGVGLRLWQDYRDRPKPTPPQQAVEQSARQTINGNFKAAHEEVNKALQANNLTDAQKYQLYTQQAATYYNESKYDQALDSYQKAAGYKEDQGLYSVMAQIAEQVGDKQAAIRYYKKAISLIPSDSPVGGADKENYEERIRVLGEEP